MRFIAVYVFFTALLFAQGGEEILEKAIRASGGEQWGKLKALRFKQILEINTPVGKVSSEGVILFVKPNKLWIRAKIAGVDVEEVYNGKEGWLRQFGRVRKLTPQEIREVQSILESLRFQLLLPYRKGKITAFENTKVGSEKAIRLTVRLKGKTYYLYLHREVYRLLKVEEVLPKGVVLTSEFRDPVVIEGFRFYRKVKLYQNGKKIGQVENSLWEVNPKKIPYEKFQSPFPKKKASRKEPKK